MAAGDAMAVFFPADNEPPAANFATLDYRNSRPVLDFDSTVDESAVFTGMMPHYYAGGGLNVSLFWMATSAVSGICRWAAAWEAVLTSFDLDNDNFGVTNSGPGGPNATNGVLTVTTISFTAVNANNQVAGGLFRLKVTRDADGTVGPDDMTGDAELLAVEVRES